MGGSRQKKRTAGNGLRVRERRGVNLGVKRHVGCWRDARQSTSVFLRTTGDAMEGSAWR